MSMQKGKPRGSKTGYLQEPLTGGGLEDASNSGGWRTQKGEKGRKMNVYFTVVGSSDFCNTCTQLGNSSLWAGAWKLILWRN